MSNYNSSRSSLKKIFTITERKKIEWKQSLRIEVSNQANMYIGKANSATGTEYIDWCNTESIILIYESNVDKA